MRASLRRTTVLAVAVTLTAALAACDREDDEREDARQTVSMDQVPPAVKATITAQSGGATVQSIEKVDRQGHAAYEAHLVANGKKREVRVGEDGKVLPAESKHDDPD